MKLACKYKSFTFEEFFNIVKDYLNYDLWIIIYNMSTPKFKENEKCIYKLTEKSSYEAEISFVYYFPNRRQYYYSVKWKLGLTTNISDNQLVKKNI